MKPQPSLFPTALFAILIFLLAAGQAFEPDARYEGLPLAEGQIAITAEVVALPLATYRELTKDGTPPGDATEFRARIGKLIDGGKAQLETVATIRTRSGQRAKTESGDEKIYPTEYDEFGVPTALETRELGTSLETDPVIGADDITVELNIAFEITELMGMVKSTYTHQESGKKFDIEQPNFYSRKTTTAVQLHRGGWVYVGTLGVKGDPEGKSGKIGLFFIGVDGVK